MNAPAPTAQPQMVDSERAKALGTAQLSKLKKVMQKQIDGLIQDTVDLTGELHEAVVMNGQLAELCTRQAAEIEALKAQLPPPSEAPPEPPLQGEIIPPTQVN